MSTSLERDRWDGARTVQPCGYAAYIRSPRWRARRGAYFARHPAVRASCGAAEQLHLHHHTYARLGREVDADLLPLCGTCHTLVHRHHVLAGTDLTTATFAVVALIDRHGREGVLRRLRKPPEPPVPDLDRGHVPRHLRGAQRDERGRLVSVLDWRDEARPWWTQPPHPVD